MSEEINSIASVGAIGAADTATAPSTASVTPAAPIAPVGWPASRVPASADTTQGSTQGSPQAATSPQSESLESAVKRLNTQLAGTNRIMQLRVDAATGITIAEIKDAATGQVLRQIPSDDVIRLAQMLAGWSHGKSVILDLIA